MKKLTSVNKHPYLLLNKIQNYAWGSKNENAFIPRLLNFEPEHDKPYAELWIGTHPKACSEIFFEGNNTPLLDVLKTRGEEILGKKCVSKYGNQFPYLLKVLSASEALSIQAHPNKEFAKILHANDPVNYPDDNHKPEIAIALDKLTALAGFKDAADLSIILDDNPEIINFLQIDKDKEFACIEHSKDKILKTLFEKLLNNSLNSNSLRNTIQALYNRIIKKNGCLTETESLFVELCKKNEADDIGLLVVFFLEVINLTKGEAFFTGAGIPHAYIKGNIVECMANSDNVVRAGLTNKFKDIAALGKIAGYNTEPIEVLKNETENNILHYKSPAEEFKISKIELNRDDEIFFDTKKSFEVLLITEGAVNISFLDDEDESFKFASGSSILIPAAATEYIIKAQLNTTLFRVTII